MKRINHILLTALVAVLLSSCGSLSISQKRYSKGLNISLFRPKVEPASNQIAKADKKKAEPVAGTPVTAPESVVYSEETGMTESTSPVVSSVPDANLTTEPQTTVEKKSSKGLLKKAAATVKARQTIKKIAAEKRNITQSPTSTHEPDSDVMLVLLVILCFILPPLAVFLYYEEINNQFWLNVLLLLAGVILYAWGISGLFLLAALVHALLVVFGVIG